PALRSISSASSVPSFLVMDRRRRQLTLVFRCRRFRGRRQNKIPEPDLFLGQTNFLLNGQSFTNASDRTMIDALHKPQIGQTSTTIPSGPEQKPIPAVECWFNSEPDNQGSYEMKLLKQGRWTHVTEKKNVGGRFPSLKKCKEGFGDVTFV